MYEISYKLKLTQLIGLYHSGLYPALGTLFPSNKSMNNIAYLDIFEALQSDSLKYRGNSLIHISNKIKKKHFLFLYTYLILKCAV